MRYFLLLWLLCGVSGCIVYYPVSAFQRPATEEEKTFQNELLDQIKADVEKYKQENSHENN